MIFNLLWFLGIGKKNYIRAGHAALVLINKTTGVISEFKDTQMSENRRCFLEGLKDHEPTFEDTLKPKPVASLHNKAQWLSGVAAGAWFELHHIGHDIEYLFKRISLHGNIDVEDTFAIQDAGFDYHFEYEFVHYSNCDFFHIQQNGTVYRFNRKQQN